MILQTARNYLATYVQNGTCTSAAIVRTTINEAQRRLYSAGNYIGTMRRWGVTVDENGEFNAPTGSALVTRIAELAETLPHSPNGTTNSMDASAFIFDSPSLLKFTQITPGRYRIIGPFPHAVDVMGKVAYRDAVQETDSMVIDDLDALKLMILGIWRENNNALQMGNELIQKAVAQLETATRMAVETAKLGLYQNQLTTANPGTRGYARVKAALALSGGERMDDGRVAMLVDDAEKRIMCQVSMWSSYLCKAVGGYFSVPREIEAILRLSINNCPTTLNGVTHEFLGYGTGYREGEYEGSQAIYRGEFALQADMPRRARITIYAEGRNRGIQISMEGRRDGITLREIVKVDGGGIATTANEYDEVTSITTQPRDGALSFVVDDTEVALMQSYETDSKRARYSIPSTPGCTPQVIRIIGRPRWIQKIRDEQRMQIENEQAITSMVASIELERAGKFEESLQMGALAVKMVNDELLHRNMGHAVKFDRTPNGLPLKNKRFGR